MALPTNLNLVITAACGLKTVFNYDMKELNTYRIALAIVEEIRGNWKTPQMLEVESFVLNARENPSVELWIDIQGEYKLTYLAS